jgi:uncharacterized membrane protein
VPALGAVLALALWFIADSADRAIGDAGVSWIYGGSASGARELMGAVAASTITVAGVVFSVTIVTLSLASQQFGPRVLRTFMRDVGNQMVLAVFIGTFLYALLVLRRIRGDDGGAEGYIPGISITTGVGLAMLSVAVLVYFIHHTAASIQANRISSVVGRELERAVDTVFPGDVAGRREAADTSRMTWLWHVRATTSGYVESIDVREILRELERLDGVALLHARPGTFAARGDVLISLNSRSEPDRDALAGHIIVGDVRTGDQDVEFVIEQLGQIALRALSPSLNDPYTAQECLHWLGAALGRAAELPSPVAQIYDARDEPRLIVAEPLTFERLLWKAFRPLQGPAMSEAASALTMLDTLEGVARRARSADRRQVVTAVAASAVEYSTLKGEDRERLRARLAALRQQSSGIVA